MKSCDKICRIAEESVDLASLLEKATQKSPSSMITSLHWKFGLPRKENNTYVQKCSTVHKIRHAIICQFQPPHLPDVIWHFCTSCHTLMNHPLLHHSTSTKRDVIHGRPDWTKFTTQPQMPCFSASRERSVRAKSTRGGAELPHWNPYYPYDRFRPKIGKNSVARDVDDFGNFSFWFF